MTNLAGLGDETFNPFGIFNFGVKGKPIFKLIVDLFLKWLDNQYQQI